VARRLEVGVWVVDARDRHAFAEAHIPGSVNIELDSTFGTYVGWVTAFGRAVRSYPTADVDDLCHAYLAGRPVQVLDVRQPGEWESGGVPGSLHVHVGDLPAELARIPRDKEVWTACANGHRASIAASLLDRAGVPVRLVAQGGVPEWLARCYPQQRAVAAR